MCLTDGQGGATPLVLATEGNKGLTAGTWHVLTVQQVPNSVSTKDARTTEAEKEHGW